MQSQKLILIPNGLVSEKGKKTYLVPRIHCVQNSFGGLSGCHATWIHGSTVVNDNYNIFRFWCGCFNIKRSESRIISPAVCFVFKRWVVPIHACSEAKYCHLITGLSREFIFIASFTVSATWMALEGAFFDIFTQILERSTFERNLESYSSPLEYLTWQHSVGVVPGGVVQDFPTAPLSF